jgi:ribosomal protein S18 acetylase RimI-like enzyme
MSETARIRDYRPGDEAAAYHVCLKTGDHGKDGEPYYREDPDALGRIYVGPYLAYEPRLALMLEDAEGVAGYALAALASQGFYERYAREWCADLCQRFPEPTGDPAAWTRVQAAHYLYHHPDTFCPEPAEDYPSHAHIDLLLRVRGHGWGRRMMTELMERLRKSGSPGVHLGVSMLNEPALAFYQRLDFRELTRVGTGADGCIYLGRRLTGG